MYGQACIHKTELFISKFEVFEIAFDIFLLFLAKFVTPQTRKGPKREKDISKVPVDFVPFDNSIQIKSYQVPTSRIIIIIPLNILPK